MRNLSISELHRGICCWLRVICRLIKVEVECNSHINYMRGKKNSRIDPILMGMAIGKLLARVQQVGLVRAIHSMRIHLNASKFDTY